MSSRTGRAASGTGAERGLRATRTAGIAAVTVLVLGLNWPIMAIGVRAIPPLWFGVLRLGGAGLVLAGLLVLTSGLRPPSRSDRAIVLSVALLRLAVSQGLIFVALTFVASGRASVLVYTSALWVAPLSVWLLHERLGYRSMVAVAAGTSGVVVLMQPWETGGSRPVLGGGLLVLAAVTNALGAVHIRGHRWEGDQIQLMAWQLLLAAWMLVPVAIVVHGPPTFALTPEIVAIVAYQVLLASLVGFWGTVTLARRLPAVTTGMVSLGTPVVGVASSALTLGEVLDAPSVAGMGLIVGGVVLRLTDGGGGSGRAGGRLQLPA